MENNTINSIYLSGISFILFRTIGVPWTQTALLTGGVWVGSYFYLKNYGTSLPDPEPVLEQKPTTFENRQFEIKPIHRENVITKKLTKLLN